MAGISSVTLPHATIPTQMFGNVNLQNAVMYVNDNFKALLNGANANATATNDALKGKSDATHTHDEAYAAIGHIHQWQEIQGLSAMLDGKAELNHEHAQYLSSLPAHYHDVGGIQGLGESLQGKADKTHQHTMQQVDGLTTELGVKASTAYVDQKVGQIGSSIKPIVEQIVDSRAIPNTSADNAPLDVSAKPANETDAQKKSRIGESSYYARSDHKHVFSAETGTPKKVGGDKPFPNDTEEEIPEGGETLWETGSDNGAEVIMLFKSGEAPLGIDLMACKLTISSIGTITKIEAIKGGGINLPV